MTFALGSAEKDPMTKEILMTDLYDIKVETITGETISLSEYRDQALLIVNLASQ